MSQKLIIATKDHAARSAHNFFTQTIFERKAPQLIAHHHLQIPQPRDQNEKADNDNSKNEIPTRLVGFAPFDKPEIAVAAVVEHGCHGSSAAAPVAREVVTTYMKKYNPELYDKYVEEDAREYREIIRRQKAAAEAAAAAEAESATPEPTESEE